MRRRVRPSCWPRMPSPSPARWGPRRAATPQRPARRTRRASGRHPCTRGGGRSSRRAPGGRTPSAAGRGTACRPGGCGCGARGTAPRPRTWTWRAATSSSRRGRRRSAASCGTRCCTPSSAGSTPPAPSPPRTRRRTSRGGALGSCTARRRGAATRAPRRRRPPPTRRRCRSRGATSRDRRRREEDGVIGHRTSARVATRRKPHPEARPASAVQCCRRHRMQMETAPQSRCGFPEGPRTGQSARSVTVGSTRAARRDGSQLATSATAASSAATPTNVTGSLALTS